MPAYGSCVAVKRTNRNRILHSIVGILLACATASVAVAQSSGLAAEGYLEAQRAHESAFQNRQAMGGLGGSLSTQLEPPTSYSQSSAPDGFLNATPVQYPWYEFDEADDPPEVARPPLPPPARRDWKSFGNGPRFSSIRGEYTIIVPDNDGFGLSATDLSMPIEARPDSGLFVTPRFNWTFLSDPDGIDIPNSLFGVSLRAEFWIPKGDYWLFQFFIEPSLFSDFHAINSDAFRLPGQAMAFYQYASAWQLAGGIAYLDRADITLLPAGGLIYKPNDRIRFDIIFPRPKFAWQYGCDPCIEKWMYFLGEFGGNSWAVSRPIGDDVLSYRDIRILFGVEHKRKDSFSWLFETGIVVNRQVEYQSGIGDFDADPSLMGRVAIKF